MARRAKFGRRVQTQPSVNGTIIAIAREMQARRDQNIMEAWKNGGKFEGRAVTDEIAMAYWKQRRSTLDKADPTYDTINSQVMQLEYAVAQSKQDLLYVQGKISDTEYAQFFLNWAKKVPKNGEFWRVLQKDAARLLENAKEKVRVNGEKAKQEAFNAFVESKNREVAAGAAITDAINRLSQETGLSVTGNGDRLLELLTEDYAEHPGRYRALQDAIRGAGGTFSGVFTSSYVSNAVSDAEGALDAIATRAKRDGYTSAYTSAVKGQADMATWAANMTVWPVATAYSKAYEAFAKVWNDPTVSYRDKMSAAATLSGVVEGLAKVPGIDNATQTMLQADALRLQGEDAGDSPSFGMAQLGHAGVTPDMAQTIAVQRLAQETMDQNPGMFAYAPTTKDGQFDVTGKGPVGIVPMTAIPPSADFVAIPGLDGRPSMVAVQSQPVYVKDPNDPSRSPVEVGRYISYQVGGRTIQMYGYQDQNGNAKWSLRSPFADGTQAVTNNDGSITLTVPQVSPLARAQQLDEKYGTNIAQQLQTAGLNASASAVGYQRDGEGRVIGKLTVKFDGKGFAVTQTAVTRDSTGREVEGNTVSVPIEVNSAADLARLALAPTRVSGADIAGSYSSPLAGSVASSAMTMSGSQIATLAQDPAFQHAFLQQTMRTLGTQNPLDQRVQDAWNRVTAGANQGWQMHDEALRRTAWGSAMDRDDLKYPGMRNDQTKTNISLTFNGQQISLPNVPAYMTSLPPEQIAANAYGPWAPAGQGFAQTVLQPGQQPGMPATVVSPTSGQAVTVKPPTVNTTPTIKPPSVQKPVVTTAPPTKPPPGVNPDNWNAYGGGGPGGSGV